ncbi:MAG: chemotaxis protein CheW [Acidobacteriota bacterium]
MKKKRRRSGSGSEESRHETPAADTTADGSSDANADDSASASPSEPAAPKRSLPAFGFAADLLKRTADGPSSDDRPAVLESSSEGQDPDDAPSAPKETQSAGPGESRADSPTKSTGLGNGLLDFEGAPSLEGAPTRVFDFADRLDDGRRAQEEVRPVKLGTFVAFDLAGETYAMPVDPVRQVVRVSTITRVPHAPRPIRGVTNLRGRVIPVIDLRLRIGLPETQVGRSSRVVSVSSRGRLIGLLVDAVHQVVHLDLYKVQPPPDDVMTLQSDYIEGVYGEGDDLILLLDIDKALIIREAGAA